LFARAGQSAALGEGEQGVGAALVEGAGVAVAHRGRHLGEPFVDDGAGRGGQGAAQAGHPVGLVGEGDAAFGVGVDAAFLGGVGIDVDDFGVDGVDDPGA
jgi:hypothetical protein